MSAGMVIPMASAEVGLMANRRSSAYSTGVSEIACPEDLGNHPARLAAVVFVVKGVSGGGAPLHAIEIASDQGYSVLAGHLNYALQACDDGVISKHGNGVHAADQ